MANTDSIHSSNFARRAASFQSTPTRELFALSMKPGMISLAGGNPDLSMLPMELVAQMAHDVIAQEGGKALQYGDGAGTQRLHELICEVMAAESITASTENILVTSGSQMALDIVTRLFLDEGDVVLVEGPSYSGALNVFRAAQAELAHVSMDESGLIPELLQRRLDELEAAGKRPKLLYTIPNFNNPAGISLATARRQAIVDICRNEGIAIVEDNPYGLINFDGEHKPALYNLDPENVFYLGSFSKIFSPGIRVGWIAAPDPVIRKRLQLAAQTLMLCAPVLSQMLAERFIGEYDWRAYLDRANATYANRRDAVLRTLAERMPRGTTWTTPTGGFFIWVTLPDGCAVDDFLTGAVAKGVVFVPGVGYYADGQGTNKLRIAYSFESEDVLVRGVELLAEAISESIRT